MKKQNKICLFALPFFALLILSGCSNSASSGGTDDVPDGGKPLVFFNRQPSLSDGSIDMDVMNWNKETFYVTFDATGGGDLQGKMIRDYLETAPAGIDRNNDDVIGYVLCIGDVNHRDSKARTKGVRMALGTWKDSDEPGAGNTKVGSVTIAEKTYKVAELESKEMKNSDESTLDKGSTWHGDTAKTALEGWLEKHDKAIDLVISNNDGMAMACLKASGYPENLPIFGYDADPEALEAIKNGKLTGSVSQNVDAQALSVLQVIRNSLDGLSGSEVRQAGFTKADQYGNKISGPVSYDPKKKTFSGLNALVTKENHTDYEGKRDSNISQISAPEKKVLVIIYNDKDAFMNKLYIPALKYYAPLLKLDLTIKLGDGENESSCLDNFTDLTAYDAYALNMVKSVNGNEYLNKLREASIR